ncbi:hypothetical protein PLICRDRAFT_55336 [Plicaturopsis crispa FD-325 SS-3]|nr:hypothetical protein PLICRDRAFT_55336 [Plicaturopsis crispa FD-325 SS-3]
MTLSRAQLLKAAQALCADFASGTDLDTLLSHFSTTHQPTAIEYGDPSLAPFLGRKFTGDAEIRRYIGIIGSVLSYQNMSFSEWTVDTEVRKVCVKGKGRFTWTSTQESWDETFAYMLDFDEDLKVTNYQIWADSGAAYLARVGKLVEEQKKASEQK